MLVVVVAVHQGAFLAVKPVAERFCCQEVRYLLDGVSADSGFELGLPTISLGQLGYTWDELDNFLKTNSIDAVVRGTSDIVEGIDIEEMVSVLAKKLAIPVFVIEDYPGNYHFKRSHRLDGLFVEGGSIAKLHSSRGVDPEIIHQLGNPRYHSLMGIDSEYLRTHTRNILGLGLEKVVLWAGQPDGSNSYLALKRFLDNGAEMLTESILLFRAHPRDMAYISGSYNSLLMEKDIRIIDVSDYENPFGLYACSDLIVTQFSSAGVEGSYLNVPSLYLLFDDLAKDYLKSSKGYDEPPWCYGDSSFVVEYCSQIPDVISRALSDELERERILLNFKKYFHASLDTPQLVTNQILKTLEG